MEHKGVGGVYGHFLEAPTSRFTYEPQLGIFRRFAFGDAYGEVDEVYFYGIDTTFGNGKFLITIVGIGFAEVQLVVVTAFAIRWYKLTFGSDELEFASRQSSWPRKGFRSTLNRFHLFGLIGTPTVRSCTTNDIERIADRGMRFENHRLHIGMLFHSLARSYLGNDAYFHRNFGVCCHLESVEQEVVEFLVFIHSLIGFTTYILADTSRKVIALHIHLESIGDSGISAVIRSCRPSELDSFLFGVGSV